jgi:fructuronate reductase
VSARLSRSTTKYLSPLVRQPDYARDAQACGMVHLGIGAFHRGHQAVYTDDAMNAGDRDWSITGVSLRSADVRDQLAPQDGLFTVSERGPAGSAPRLIGSVRNVLVAQADPESVVAAIAARGVCIVTLTVTEKGYASTGEGSIYAYLGSALARRRALGWDGLTIVSCDNLPGNGERLAAALGEHLQSSDPDTANWFRTECACPSSMVDRIVPMMSEADRAEVATVIGVRDEGAVVTERFHQWVIEDRFAGARPRWEAGGARFVTDVRPFEAAKLRMLNGAHSALAYLGLARGFEYVHQAIGDPAIASLVNRLMRQEAVPTLPPIGMDMHRYADDLIERFANVSLPHRLRQIAMDGSQKIPQRWLATLSWHSARGQSCPAILTALAAWIDFVRGNGHVVDDPMALQLADLWRTEGRRGIVPALFAPRGLFATSWTCSSDEAAMLTGLLAPD